MTDTINTNGVSKIGLGLSIAASGFVLLGIIGSMFYVAFSGKSNSDALMAQFVINKSLSDEIRALQLKLGAMEVAQNEIETQFCAQDIVRNLMHANDQRVASLLWEKVYGLKMPTDNAFYPTICNRRVKQ